MISLQPSRSGLGKAKRAISAVAGHILDDTTLLGVPGTFDLDGLLETLVYAAGKLTMTISSTTTVDPVFTAALLTGANDFLWVAPNGTHFVGKIPAGANFVTGGVGTYRVYCTDWSLVTGFAADSDTVTAVDVAVATALTTLDLDGNLFTSPPTLTGLTSLVNLHLSGSQFTSPPVLTGLTALVNIDLGGNRLTSPPVLTGLTALASLYLNNNQLTSAGVDAVLVALAAGTVNGGQVYQKQTSAAIPGAAGLAAKATLEGAPRLWTVSVDS